MEAVKRCKRCRHPMIANVSVIGRKVRGGVLNSYEHAVRLLPVTRRSRLQQIASDCFRVGSQFPWPPLPSPVRSDWQRRSNIWPTWEAIQRWFYTWVSYAVLFSSFQIDREEQRMKESLWRRRRRKEKNLETRECASLSFFFLCLCVPVSSTLKDVCLFCQSAETSVDLFFSVCLCAGLVLQQHGRGIGGGGCVVWGHRGTHGWYVGTFAKVNLVTGGYSISSC